MSRPITMEEWRLVQLFKKQNPEPEFPEPIPPPHYWDNMIAIMGQLANEIINGPIGRHRFKPPLTIDKNGRASRDFQEGEAIYEEEKC